LVAGREAILDGQASRAGRFLRHAPSADSLEQHLHEQVEFLRSHAANFDEGKDHFAQALAAVLRTLLHRTALAALAPLH